jgi:hypothetical protein
VTWITSLGSLSPSLFSAMMRRWYEHAGFKFCTVAVVCVPGTVSFSGWVCQTSAGTDSSCLYSHTTNSMGQSPVWQFDTCSAAHFPALDKTWRFITVLTKAHYVIIAWGRWNQLSSVTLLLKSPLCSEFVIALL